MVGLSGLTEFMKCLLPDTTVDSLLIYRRALTAWTERTASGSEHMAPYTWAHAVSALISALGSPEAHLLISDFSFSLLIAAITVLASGGECPGELGTAARSPGCWGWLRVLGLFEPAFLIPDRDNGAACVAVVRLCIEFINRILGRKTFGTH